MGNMNRRDFLKTGTAALGTTVLAEAASHLLPNGGALAQAAGPAPEYEIYAAKYGGTLVRNAAIALWNTGWNEEGQINFYVWAIKAKDGSVTLVDTGPSPALGAARKIPNYVDPIDVVARIGATANSVNRVIITHMHYDHVGNIAGYLTAFPNAKFYLQKREFDFCVKDPVCERKPIVAVFDPPSNKIVAGLERSDRLVMVDGDFSIAPGLDLVLAPGHTLGLQVVRVNTAKGPAIVGSDLAHMFRGYKEDIPSVYIMNLPDWIRSFDKVKAMAPLEYIFPGHDVLMSLNYPTVAESVTRLV